MNKLDQLKQFSGVVADTGDIDSIIRFQPEDATTNPSLLLKAAQLPRYQDTLQQCITAAGLDDGADAQQLQHCMDLLAVAIACEILQTVPGRVSVEVDARLSFNTEATVAKAHKLMDLFARNGVGPERILIKIASTWEGIEAAKQLEREGIHCNLTLLFGFAQAVACADAGVTLISPFVGRILDWYKNATGKSHYAAEEDPGVISVRRIYNYYKQHDYNTIVMGASFRNTGEIEALAGCDKLTISPALLDELKADTDSLQRCLHPQGERTVEPKIALATDQFRWSMNEDAMATEKLAEGIRNFAADQARLERQLVELSQTAELSV